MIDINIPAGYRINDSVVVNALTDNDLCTGVFLVVMSNGYQGLMLDKGIQIPGTKDSFNSSLSIVRCHRGYRLNVQQMEGSSGRRKHLTSSKVEKIFRLNRL